MAYHAHTFDFLLFSLSFSFVFFFTLTINYVLCLQVRKNQEVIGTAFGRAAVHTLCSHEKTTVNIINLQGPCLIIHLLPSCPVQQ